MKIAQDDYTLALLYLTRTVECPDEFMVWSSYAQICTVLRDNVRIEFPNRKTSLYPNMYIMILADSGHQRKSNPLKIMHHMVSNVGNTKIIKGRASIQGILKELIRVIMLDNGVRLDGATGVIYSEEFAASLVQDSAVIPILTEIYDYHEKHDVILKGEDPQVLRNVVVSMFTATNLSHLTPMLTQGNLTGGFVGRVILVTGNSYKEKSLDLNSNAQTEEWNWLQNCLVNMSKIRGSALIPLDSYSFFDRWYKKFEEENDCGTGFNSRLHSHVEKLMLLKAACKTSYYSTRELKITDEETLESMHEIYGIRHSYVQLVTGSTSSVQSTVGVVHTILHYLIKTQFQKLERSELLSNIIRYTDIKSFNDAIETLTTGGLVDASSYNGTIFYNATKKALKTYGGGEKKEEIIA